MLCDQEMEPPSLYGNDPCATVTVATIRNLGTCKSFIIFGLGGFGLKRVDADKAARTDCAAAYLQVIEHLTPEGGGRLSYKFARLRTRSPKSSAPEGGSTDWREAGPGCSY